MPIKYQSSGPVTTITIDRAEAMNAIDPETHEALVEAWTRFRDDRTARVAILMGAGSKAFCAGIDLKKLGEFYARHDAQGRREAWDREPGLGGITRNLDVGKPVIAAINGHCLGGGLELALACDLRIASTRASFGMPEVKWGIIPGQGGTQRLPRAVGPTLAMELILTGAPITARRAYGMGLVNRVVAPSQLMHAAHQLAEAIAAHPPRAVRHAREAIRRGLEIPIEEGLRIEQGLADVLRDSPESRTARAAFGR